MKTKNFLTILNLMKHPMITHNQMIPIQIIAIIDQVLLTIVALGSIDLTVPKIKE